MLRGVKVIAFTPCGRKRYMDILAGHMMALHDRRLIDEWVLFDNPMNPTDWGYAQQLAYAWPWVRVVGVAKPDAQHYTIYEGYKHLTDPNAIYVRVDDDIVYIEMTAMDRLVGYRLDNPSPFLVYPTTINNTRTSFQQQKVGKIEKKWKLTDVLCDPVAWTDSGFVANLHERALSSIGRGTVIEDFGLASQGALSASDGNISINAFAMMGADMVGITVSPDEERCLSLELPNRLRRPNARCGDAIFVHFAYGPQTEFMVKTGLLGDYANLAPALPFRTKLGALL